MSFLDYFKKAKDARKAKEDKEKDERPKFGFLGSKSKAYKEAQQALADEEEHE